VPHRTPAQRVLELADRLLSGTPDDAAQAELSQSLSCLGPGERALADRVVQLSRDRRDFKRGLVQSAKLAEVGLAFAELVHELRQPLSTISGFAQLVGPTTSGERVAQSMEEILLQCDRMEAMLERMRRFLRPDPGEEKTEPGLSRDRGLDVAEALRTAVALCPKMPPGVQLEVQLAPGLGRSVGEAQPFAQVVLNLLANARDAQAAKGPGTVLLCAERRGDQVVVTVADEGTGIPPDFAAKLFEPFTTTKGEAGTGLGLYICQEILAPWGAEVALLAPPPKPYVTAFAVRLRAAPSQQPASGGGSTGLAALSAELAERVSKIAVAREVLVVDDEPGMRRLLKVLLSAEDGLTLSEASDGPAALKKLLERPVQVLVADQGLPGMTGLELARRARAERRASEAVIVTGFPSPESVVQALDAGAKAYLLKPVEDAGRLRGAVRAALQRDRLRQLVSGLGAELRPWAERAVSAALAASAGRRLREALELLSKRPEGPARVAVVGERALVGPLAVAGHRAEGPWDLPRAFEAAATGEVEAVIVAEGADAARAREFLQQLCERPYPPAVLWALPAGGFAEALALLDSAVASVVARPVDPTALSLALTAAVETRRREVRASALGAVLAELGIDA
jgi:signal transduction histidine kinase/DNA-binding response OmpR family regulator